MNKYVHNVVDYIAVCLDTGLLISTASLTAAALGLVSIAYSSVDRLTWVSFLLLLVVPSMAISALAGITGFTVHRLCRAKSAAGPGGFQNSFNKKTTVASAVMCVLAEILSLEYLPSMGIDLITDISGYAFPPDQVCLVHWATSILAVGVCGLIWLFQFDGAAKAQTEIRSGDSSLRDLKSDTWVATDALGRRLPGYEECGSPRKDRYVGIFYFSWLGQHGTQGPYDISAILAENPEQRNWGPRGRYHHWGQPELGYYLSTDEYVIRKHAYMLSDAGVDTIIFDATNNLTYEPVYSKICQVYRKMREEGEITPQICFLATKVSADQLWQELYSQGKFQELWFRWHDKPLLLLGGSPDMPDPEDFAEEVRCFFTMRGCWAWSTGPFADWFKDGHHSWPWLDHHPQNYGWDIERNTPEETSVCVSQHASTGGLYAGNIGRSFHDGRQPRYDPSTHLSGYEHLGLCFAEQWRRALEIDPEFIFITGWNEWVASRLTSKGDTAFLGQKIPAGGAYFADTYNQEFSRDIEPMKGGHTDNYYYQMIDGIRRFMGVRQPEAATEAKTVSIDGDFADWDDVGPEFLDAQHDTTHRNEPGWGDAGVYVNSTGRNDFVRMKVAWDEEYAYFYAQTAESITDHGDRNWMLLFIDADQDQESGWQGYDYVVNMQVNSADTTTLQSTTSGWNWVVKNDRISYRVMDNEMELRIPRADIEQAGSDGVSFDFHWADNIQKADNIMEFSISGDSAPNRRFNYRFNTAERNAARQ